MGLFFWTAFHVLTGCSFLTPGLDTRTAAESKSSTSWDKDSNLMIHDETTHNRRTVAAESAGENGLEMEYYPDGSPKTVKGASHHLSQWSEPKDVMDAYAKLAQENAKVAAKLTELTEAIFAMLQPVLLERIRVSGNAASQPAIEGPELRGGILDIIQKEIARQREGQTLNLEEIRNDVMALVERELAKRAPEAPVLGPPTTRAE